MPSYPALLLSWILAIPARLLWFRPSWPALRLPDLSALDPRYVDWARFDPRYLDWSRLDPRYVDWSRFDPRYADLGAASARVVEALDPRTLRLRSVRTRAALGLGVVGLVFTGGTYAHWTDSATIDGGAFTAGQLDLKVNNADSYTMSLLSMASMVPGNSAAEVITIKNAGNVPLKYNVSGGLGGADASSYSGATALKISISLGGTRSGSGNSATCTGGTPLVTGNSLTGGSNTLVALRGPVASNGTESLCVQVSLDPTAPSSLQGKVTSVALTATGTSDLS